MKGEVNSKMTERQNSQFPVIICPICLEVTSVNHEVSLQLSVAKSGPDEKLL